jgi:acetyl esterase/lipase
MICEKIKLWNDDNEAYLQTYILNNSLDFKTGERRPAVIICPGGAYFKTTDREAEPVAMRFATLGYSAFVLRYNTYYGDKVIDRRNPPPGNEKTAYPQPLYDLAQAILTIRENAEAWFIDTSKIILCGFSAGGHLVSSMGVHWQDELLTSKFGVDSELFRPSALILGYPLTDYLLMKEGAKDVADAGAIAFQEFANKVVFGKSNPTDEELMKASPANYVSDKTPPTFIWHTADDESVYVPNSLRFASMLTKYKVPYELHIFESGVHGLSLADETTAAKSEHVNPGCQIWFELAARWLKKGLGHN